ncbi:MAG TPA: 16S rRNA (cytidine(1402)-2'-O)-methyltransferase [Mycobacteriales bacterium]|jgi:16S rRNA (cytidine1402-2'-O)-methyltransferase|nr:16S rRNA (cytidine(1402)-2'-O)-methyltransferase [Mycobacteriales bacterium]
MNAVPLVLAATPIGDPRDASARLVEALAQADVIAAEDTRRLRRLATALGVTVTARVVALYDAVERGRAAGLLDDVAAGSLVVVVSDAGVPLVSDPGYLLLSEAIARGLPVTALPGPSAVTTAIALSGVPVDRWCFEGFLPRKSGERRSRLVELAHDPRALVVFESPKRVAVSLVDLAAVFGAARRAAVCRELTKTHEEVRRGTLGELAEWAADRDVLGEVTLVVAGADRRSREVDPESLHADVAALMASGSTRRDAVDAVAASTGLSRRVVYEAATRPQP